MLLKRPRHYLQLLNFSAKVLTIQLDPFLCRHSSGSPKVPTFDGEIPLKQIQFTYSLSSGPGGQNVQKVATKVELRFHVDTASWLSDDVKEKFRQKHQITKDGFFIVKSDLTRSQTLNQADAVQKLRIAIFEAITPPKVHAEIEEEKSIRLLQEVRRNRRRIKDKRIQSQRRCEKRNLDWSNE